MVAQAMQEVDHPTTELVEPEAPKEATETTPGTAMGSGPKQEFYVKRVRPKTKVGYNDIEILKGSDPKGTELAYYVDVGNKLAGWDITLHPGSREAPPTLRLQKGVRVWDKNSEVTVEDLTVPELVKSADAEPVEMPQGSEGRVRKVTKLIRKHAYRSNENVFEFKGRQYAWNYRVLIGATHTLADVETGEVVAVCRLKPLWHPIKIVTDWGLRLNGPVEVMGPGLEMVDLVIGTLCATLEWRKHNNKVWIIVAAIA